MFEKEIVIDAKGHMFGRLASYVAKELLNGQKIVVVRTEGINISGSLFRNKLKYMEFLRKTRNANPRRGHIHYRNPARIFWRTVRGMIPHKTQRGMEALGRLKAFEGVPYPYDHKKRLVVPDALRVLRIKPFRDTCVLGDLASQVGWTKQELVGRLEEKRVAKSAKYWAVRKAKIQTRAKAANSNALKTLNAALAKHGY